VKSIRLSLAISAMAISFLVGNTQAHACTISVNRQLKGEELRKVAVAAYGNSAISSYWTNFQISESASQSVIGCPDYSIYSVQVPVTFLRDASQCNVVLSITKTEGNGRDLQVYEITGRTEETCVPYTPAKRRKAR
jgi:hypothetical protein